MTFEGSLGRRTAGLAALAAVVFAGCESTAPDLTPPAVAASIPAPLSVGVLVNSAISVTFSEPMNASTINTGSVQLKVTSSAAPVSGTVSYDAATNTAKLTPASALAYSTTYTVAITTAASDVAGNGLSAPYTLTFSTIRNLAGQPYFQGTDVAGQIHFHMTLAQSGNTITLGSPCPPLPQAWCEIFPLNQAGADAIGPASPNQNGGSLITAIAGTFTDPGITFTITIANGRTFTFTGTVADSNTMTGTIAGATLQAVALSLSREVTPEAATSASRT